MQPPRLSGFNPSTQARQARRGRLPSTSYAALRDRCGPGSAAHYRASSRASCGVRVFWIEACVGYYTREVSSVPWTTPGAIYRPERPDCQSKVALSALAILLREAPHRCPTSHRIAAKKSTATAAGGCPITGRGTRKHTSTTELHHLDARRRGHAACRRRVKKMRSTSCRGCAAFL